jgi:hypothetical protein
VNRPPIRGPASRRPPALSLDRAFEHGGDGRRVPCGPGRPDRDHPGRPDKRLRGAPPRSAARRRRLELELVGEHDHPKPLLARRAHERRAAGPAATHVPGPRQRELDRAELAGRPPAAAPQRPEEDGRRSGDGELSLARADPEAQEHEAGAPREAPEVADVVDPAGARAGDGEPGEGEPGAGLLDERRPEEREDEARSTRADA